MARSLPPSTYRALGNLHNERQHLQSTKMVNTEFSPKQQKEIFPITDNKDMFPNPTQPNENENKVVYQLILAEKSIRSYQDLTGRLPMK